MFKNIIHVMDVKTKTRNEAFQELTRHDWFDPECTYVYTKDEDTWSIYVRID